MKKVAVLLADGFEEIEALDRCGYTSQGKCVCRYSIYYR